MRLSSAVRSTQQIRRGRPRLAVLLTALSLLALPATVIAQTADPVDPDPDAEPVDPDEEPTEPGPASVEILESGGASVGAFAVRSRPDIGDFVSVYNSGALRDDTESRAVAAAQRAGARFAIRGAASIAMQSITRDGSLVQSAPSNMSIPMGTTVIDKSTIASLMGFEVAGALDSANVVMSELTASLRGAQAGDVVTLRSSGGSDVRFTIGAVVADQITGGTELLITPEAAQRIGLDRESGVLIWGFESRDAIDTALDANGLVSTSIRIRRSWDAFDPDSTLGMARTKEALGEFGYRVNSNGSVSQEPAWQTESLPSGRRNVGIGIRARCHLVIEPALNAAFAEIASRGLSGVFDVGDANLAGGCHVPRFNRLTPNSTIGFLSRHSWGMAVDTNTRTACQGCAPPSFVFRTGGCDAVRIMRKHGFAWGGNFLTPDGMHFEYVGERRDQFAYPSRWCANDVSSKNALSVETTQRGTMFSDAGLAHGH